MPSWAKELILLIGVTAIAVVLAYILIEPSDNTLAVLGGVTALASVVLTSLTNIYKINLEKEKLEQERIGNITKDAYKEMFMKKIDVYNKTKQLIRDFERSKQEIDYEIIDYGYDSLEYVDKDDVVKYAEAVKTIIEYISNHEILISKEMHGIYDRLLAVYLNALGGYNSYKEYVAASPDEHWHANKNFSEALYQHSEIFEELTKQLDAEINDMRSRISF